MKKKRIKKTAKKPYIRFNFKNHRVMLVLDKVLIFRYIRHLHGRFWGVTAISGLVIGLSICFAIRPDMLVMSTAFSDFGNDVRTAPYFAGSVFFTAYGLWHWRNYLSRTWRHARPVTGLITLTVIGLYMVALMPVSWKGLPHNIHMFGVVLTGVSMLATVIFDGLLSKTRRTAHQVNWRFIRLASTVLIVLGGYLTFMSAEIVNKLDVALAGECLMLAGYALWVSVKTYQGEGNQTILARTLKKIVLID